MSNSWAAIVRPTQVIFCPLDANSNSGDRIPEMLELLGPEWAEYTMYHPEITTGEWPQGRQISISWPENEETRQKLKYCLESAGILTQEIVGVNGFMNVREITQAAAILVLMKRAGIGLTAGNLELLNQNDDLHGFNIAIRNLESAKIPLTRALFLFMALPKKHAEAIGNAILRFHHAKIPLTQDIRVFLGENIEHVKKLSCLITRIHLEGMPLTEEIFKFLARACKSRDEMKAKSLADVQVAGIPDLHLSYGSEEMHAEALFQAVAAFHSQGELPPDEVANCFAEYETAVSKRVSRRLPPSLTPTIRQFSLLGRTMIEKMSQGFLRLHQDGVPLTETNVAFLLNCYLMRALGICEVVEYLYRKKIDLTPEIQNLLYLTVRITAFGLLEEMHEKEIPLTEETANLIAESYAARIGTLGVAIERLGGVLTLENTEFLSTHARTLSLTTSTIAGLHEGNIPITPEIREFLIAVNRADAHEIVTEASPPGDNLIAANEMNGPLYWQLPAMALRQLHQAGCPLQRETFGRIRGRNGREMLTLLWIINRLGESGLLTPENFRAATAGAGSRAGEIMARLKALPPEFDQDAWEATLRDIQEKEWEPCRNATIVFCQRNRMGEQQLPPAIIGKIAGYLAPPEIPQYERAAFHLADRGSFRERDEG